MRLLTLRLLTLLHRCTADSVSSGSRRPLTRRTVAPGPPSRAAWPGVRTQLQRAGRQGIGHVWSDVRGASGAGRECHSLRMIALRRLTSVGDRWSDLARSPTLVFGLPDPEVVPRPTRRLQPPAGQGAGWFRASREARPGPSARSL